ncbi:MAG: hypothetical protein PHV43_02135 [Candidatus Colwellbacteria bacterium]|nr:hypothetical protein [Candidatus Colwellbacteria bacterium]
MINTKTHKIELRRVLETFAGLLILSLSTFLLFSFVYPVPVVIAAVAIPTNADTTLYAVVTNPGSATLTIPVPSGVSDGSYLLFIAETYGWSTWNDPPNAAFTTIKEKHSASGDTYSVVAAYHYVASAASEPFSYDFVANNSNYQSGMLLIVTGADSSDFLAGTATDTEQIDDSTPTNAAMTTDADNAQVVLVLGTSAWGDEWAHAPSGVWECTPPSGYTWERDATPASNPGSIAERSPGGAAHWDVASPVMWAHKLKATAGTETPGAWGGFTSTWDWGALTFAIKPAVVATATVDVTEGGATDTYTVVLNTQPTASVTVPVTETDTEFSVDKTFLTFTTGNWSTPQTVTVTAVDDSIDEADPYSGTITHTPVTSTDGKYSGISVDSVGVTVHDNDTAGTTGDLESATFDIGVNDGFIINSAMWNGTEVANTVVSFQLAVSNSPSGPFVFMGPNCSEAEATRYTALNSGIPVTVESDCYHPYESGYRYLRYKVFIDRGTQESSPVVNDIIINWSP